MVILEIDKENRRLTLGHKQIEENPWDVFETIFTVGSIHEGTVIAINDKNATIALSYGLEATATIKNLVKEDGTTLKIDEKAEFKVIEFSKENKKIVVSHTKVYQDAKKEQEEAEKKKSKKSKKESSISSKVEKTTLGDIIELTGLKDQLKAEEKNKKIKKLIFINFTNMEPSIEKIIIP